MKTSRTFSYITLACALLFQPALAETASENNQLGLQAFKAKNYNQALTYFNRARALGTDTSALNYNMAASYYRLQRYEEARSFFDRIKRLPKWQYLALYNLGLIAEATDAITAAENYFTLVASQDQNQKLRILAQRKLNSFRAPLNKPTNPATPATAPVKDWLVLTSLTAGLDSNAASLADDLVNSSSDTEDPFYDVLLYGQRYISGQFRDGIKLSGFVFSRQYDELDNLASRIVTLAVSREFPYRGTNLEAGLSALQVAVDGSNVSTQLQGKISASKPLGTGTGTLEYLASQYSASDDYEHLEGSQHKLQAKWKDQQGNLSRQVSYQLEKNDRKDLDTNSGFSSYSPLKNTLKGKLEWKVTPQLSTGLAAAYSRSDYSDENRVRDIDGEVKQEKRKNEKISITGEANYLLAKGLRLKSEVELSDVSDTFQVNEYDKSVFKIGLEYSF